MLRVFLSICLSILTLAVTAQFCASEKRITPENYLLQYHGIRKAVIARAKTENIDVLDVLNSCSEDPCASELCLHNRFIYSDFILYFELEDKFSKHSSVDPRAFKEALLKQRDDLYVQWLSALSNHSKNDYCEWEESDVRGESLEAFWNRGSERFYWLETIVRHMNGRPSKRKKARLVVYETLDARTLFSSIMSGHGMDFIQSESGQKAISRMQEALGEADGDLWGAALQCAEMKAEEALKVLGIVSAQRMYLIRDYKSWMDQNLSEDEFSNQWDALAQSSAIYFNIETISMRKGSSWNYPTGVEAVSHKSYHFYTTAYLGYQLAKAGFSKQESVKEATRPARKYKRGIVFPGLLHNIWLRNSLNASTVGDYGSVISEQREGAEWGWQLYQVENN